jgi:spore coat protein CotH
MNNRIIMKALAAGLSCCSSAALAQYNNSGDSIFNLPVIHRIDINSSDPGFWDSLVANYPLDRKILCSLVLDGTQQMDSVGIQLKGNSSYNSFPTNKKSMKLQFNYVISGQDWDGIKEVVLNNGFKDPTMIREKLFLDFCNRNFVYSPRCTYTNVYINNTLWGFYTLVESASSKKFLDRCFNDKKGNLFKGDPTGTLQWLGSSPSLYYNKYELKTNETQNDWSDLVELIDKINNTPASSFHDSLETILDSYSFINCWAANILFANLDSYQGSGHNYYIYHDSLINRFRFISWDVNEAFGNFQMMMNTSQMENMSAFYISNPPQNRPLEQKMLADNTYKAAYIWTLCNMLQNDFTTTHINAVIDSLANLVRPYVYADPQKQFPNNQDFDNNLVMDVGNVPGLKPFVSVRRAALMSEMANYGCYLPVEEQERDADLRIFPVPACTYLSIEFPEGQDRVEVSVLDMLGRTVLKKAFAHAGTIQLDVSALPEGIYTVNINNTLFRKVEIAR